MTETIVVAIVGALTTLAAVILTHWLEVRKAQKASKTPAKCLLKVQYTKLVHWRIQNDQHKPIFWATVPRLKDGPKSKVPVFDMTLYHGYVLFDKPLDNYNFQFRTSGVGDATMIYPFKDELVFPDRDAGLNPGLITQLREGPSTLFSAASYGFNGLQPGHEDTASMVNEDTEEVILVADYSTIPNIENLWKSAPKGILRRANGTEQSISLRTYRPGIYVIKEKDLKAGDVLMIDVDPNWELLEKGETL